ncbi:MAG: aminodeoxychorismate synthase, component I [Actinobacteria bacterium]|uniref:Unannotated protein n=1 Tax=freshwater metagenome TaxID=449393 RepID=A0A6J6A2A0_9ZZZZ|nr:aminodeoxychorismate synthase, component I [Actinomycetota bacterium]MSW77376.1 aminodeoxychorismate synthase, component I [Actinomycetota bacterium]MSX94714.1 aminodeoxychorismate synthase, component I [Actinomycetota bacterium]MSZ82693.1 aminodeoxychorismate synthase, component I [Actinomycetota bacterium]MTB17595.1 aminodeoxychorismate synthase, component I [Actinomycetota bacterium]
MNAGMTDARWEPGHVRLDDIVRGVGYEFSGRCTTAIAERPDDVPALLAAAETEAGLGRWVVCFVCYEAGEAFEPAVATGRLHPLLPLAWFTSYSERCVVPAVEPPDSGRLVDNVTRAHGGAWYQQGVERVRTAIEAGDVYQVNLTDRVRCVLAAPVVDLYRAMATTQGGSYNALIEFGHAAIVSASPELFVRLEGDTITTRPMKGTRRRHGRPEADRLVAEELLTSEKDCAENVMIVDLLRNDLSRLSVPGGVSTPELFQVERYETVWQMTSTVKARLRPDIGLVDVFSAAFPCGSVTGAPKIAAMHAIAALEPTPRGLYCGTIGLLEPATPGGRGSSTWSVAIRTAVVDATTGAVEFGAGGGITYDSDPAAEDDELESKTAVLRGARLAFSLFETLRLDAAGVHELDRHLNRLTTSAEFFGYPCDAAAIAQKVALLAPTSTLHRLRITLDRAGRVLLEAFAVDAAASPVRLAVAESTIRSDDPFLCHKTTNRTVYDAARAAHPQADDVLLVNERGEVVETTIANVLYRLGGRWYTPPLTSGGLPGIGREVLVERGVVTERVLLAHQLDECDELEVVSALRGRRRAERLLG